MDVEFPSPTVARGSRRDVLVHYLEYFRERVIARVEQLDERDLHASRLPSRWTPLELVRHLTFVELRWLEWGFEGRDVDEPWGDRRDDRWYVDERVSRGELVQALRERGVRTGEIIRCHELDEIGQPGPRWDGADEPTLERILLHLLQEYARHLGHLDVVVEIAGGPVGE